jgi:glycosyltransferase involved in cell wall biosynthesis
LKREVPAFEAVVFKPRATRFCVCIPVLNENGRLAAQLARMAPFFNLADIVMADGGSTDGSVASELLQSLGVRALLVKKGPGRLGAQLRMAFAWALDQGYDGVITMDGNNKDDPAATPLFVKALENGVDHAQGSRFIAGGRAVNTPVLRWLAVRLLHAPLIARAARFPYTDTTNGFRAYSRRLLEDPRLAVFRAVLSGYELHYYLAIRAARLGLRIAEVPVTREYPRTGKTPTKISGLKGNFGILKTLWKTMRGQYDPT